MISAGYADTIDVALIQEHQKRSVPAMKQLFRIASDCIGRIPFEELSAASCIAHATLVYRLPDNPSVISPRPFTIDIADYAANIPLSKVPDIEQAGLAAAAFPLPEQSRLIVYPNYLKFLTHWIEHLDGILQYATVAIRPVMQDRNFMNGAPFIIKANLG